MSQQTKALLELRNICVRAHDKGCSYLSACTSGKNSVMHWRLRALLVKREGGTIHDDTVEAASSPLYGCIRMDISEQMTTRTTMTASIKEHIKDKDVHNITNTTQFRNTVQEKSS